MAITNQTKSDFRNVLQSELGMDLTQSDSDKLLTELVTYFRTLRQLDRRFETPHSAQN